MSVSGFLSSIADKAQSAINQTPLAGHIPGTASSGGPSDSHAAPQGHRSFALESLQHQIRSFGQQYTSVPPIQRIITFEKGVALDFDALARDGKAQSKELYTWGQHEDPDLKDVTDRLAFLNFVHGSMSGSLVVKLDGARTSLKALRDAEAALAPKRNIRAGLRNQIVRLQHSQEKGAERRIVELKEQLSRAESHDEQLEKELELLKRKAIRESEQSKWDAIQEYGEKLILLSQAAKPILEALPTLPPADANPYGGADVTAAARASLQNALDNWKPGQVTFDLQIAADLSRSDTRSFGESHASELSSLSTPVGHPGLSVTPPIPEPASTRKEEHTAPLPSQLAADPNQTAAPNPAQPVSAVVQGCTARAAVQGPGSSAVDSPSEELYRTSPVKTEGTEEPKQPVEREDSESLPAAGNTGPPSGAESAEEEKKRLEREERERVLAASSEVRAPGGESGEEEKRRLEREEMERVLAGGANSPTGDNGEDLPPYKELA